MAGRQGSLARSAAARARATRALAEARLKGQLRRAQLFEEKVLQARRRAAEFAAGRANAAQPAALRIAAAHRPDTGHLRKRQAAEGSPLPDLPPATRPWLPRWFPTRGRAARWPAAPRFTAVRRLTALLGFGALGLMLGSALPVSSQTRLSKAPQPPVQELLQLIEAARQAGLTEDQIRQLTLQDEQGNSINAWDYLQAQLAQKRKQEELERQLRTKVYLTVRDVFADLRKGEAEDLDRLRDQLPYLK